MCGLIGMWSIEANTDALRRGLDRLGHRGPDDRGVYRSPDGAVALGHTRLSILDLSPLGHQPMISTDGDVVLVFNGEIYNFRELRAELESAGIRFRGSSDTEVLLALFLREGEAMLRRLNGIFAFALFDRRRSEMLLARDAQGVKPLYYSEGAHGFAFASELKALLTLVPQGCGLDAAALYRYLGFLWCPGTATPLRGVHRLAPGEALWVCGGRIVRRGIWAEPAWTGEILGISAGDAAQHVTAALRTAVQRQLVADVPVGAFLSGGLDSSAVVALARERTPRIDCFTIVNDGERDAGDADDLPYARHVARHLDVPLHEVRVDSAHMAADLERMVYLLDEPLADPASLNVLYISRLARDHGIKVLLSGAGGDDLFTGYRRHRALMAERAWAWMPLPLRALLRAGSASFGQQSAMGRRVAKAFAYADQPADQRLSGYFLWADPVRLRGLFTAEHRAVLESEAIDQPLLDFVAGLPEGLPRLHHMLALEQRFFLADHNLTYTDRMSMAAGVEVRVPFLDPDLVRLANRLPPSLKQHGAEGKWILKKAMEPYLPHAVIYRPKTGFGAPLRRWLRHELRELVGDLLSVETLRRRGLFEPAAVGRLIEDDRQGRVDGAYTILGLMCIELWCRRFCDGFGSTDH